MRSRVVVAVTIIAGLANAGDRGGRTPARATEEMETAVLADGDWERIRARAPEMIEIPAAPLPPRAPTGPEEERLVRDAPPQWHAAILDAAPMTETLDPIELARGTVFWEMPWHLIGPPSALEQSGASLRDGRGFRDSAPRISAQRDERLERWQRTMAVLFSEERSCVSSPEDCAASAYRYCEKAASKVRLLAFVDDASAPNPGCWTKCMNGKQGGAKLCAPTGVGSGGQCQCAATPCKWGSDACCPGVPPPWCDSADES